MSRPRISLTQKIEQAEHARMYIRDVVGIPLEYRQLAFRLITNEIRRLATVQAVKDEYPPIRCQPRLGTDPSPVSSLARQVNQPHVGLRQRKLFPKNSHSQYRYRTVPQDRVEAYIKMGWEHIPGGHHD